MTTAILASIAGSLLTSAAFADARLFHFEIPRESMSQALRTYARICGDDVIFTESVVAGTESAALMGDYSADDALSRLLSGTQLVARRSPSGALMIRRRTAQPRASPQPSSVEVRPPIAAADRPLPAARGAASLRQLSEVVVTGSRIASPSYTSDSPLVSVRVAQIAAVGQVSLDAALGQMPQFSASQGQTEVGDVQGSTGFEGGSPTPNCADWGRSVPWCCSMGSASCRPTRTVLSIST